MCMYGVCSGVVFCRLDVSVCTWQYQLILTMCVGEKWEIEENMCFEFEIFADFCLTMTAMTFSTMWRRLNFFVFLSVLGCTLPVTHLWGVLVLFTCVVCGSLS